MTDAGRRTRRGAGAALLAIAMVVVSCSTSDERGNRAAGSPTTTTIRSSSSTTTALPVAAGDGVLGYVGCSNTQLAVAGYAALGGTRFWPLEDGYGGTIAQLDDPKQLSSTFDRFDVLHAARPASAIWWQLCLSDDRVRSDDELFALATSVIQRLRQRVGDAPIYVSALAHYVPPARCKKIGDDGPARLDALADRLVAADLAVRGPTLPPLTVEVLSDACHPDVEGQELHGRVLVEFFG